jgi:Zn finger protein HypA/HybF involved in hydrogenase expression
MQAGNRVVNGHCTLRWHLQIMGLLESVKCTKCGQEEEFSYHILCQCPAFAGHRLEIFGSAWLELIDIRKASIRSVLALVVQ